MISVDRYTGFLTQPPQEETPMTTSYYMFPGGTEVRDISIHLTGAGAQIVQYAARSCRLDGNHKGTTEDRIKDMQKIEDWARWERERLEQSPTAD